jgi:glycosyltransferase involved in cell wall biosynthesis
LLIDSGSAPLHPFLSGISYAIYFGIYPPQPCGVIAFLNWAIESVLVQTEADFELIIWDDGSTDGSLEIIQLYAQQDGRIRWFHSTHQGRATALKLAHAKACADYVGWIDSDDVLSPITLERTLSVLESRPEVGMVYTDFRMLDEANMVYGLGRTCELPYSQEALLSDFMTFHFRLLRRSLYEQVGGVDCAFTAAMDYDLCLKLSEITQIHHLCEPLYFYRIHSQRISTERRMEQIECSVRAVKDALERRGLSQQFELEVEIRSRFSLKPKSAELVVRDAPRPATNLIPVS